MKTTTVSSQPNCTIMKNNTIYILDEYKLPSAFLSLKTFNVLYIFFNQFIKILIYRYKFYDLQDRIYLLLYINGNTALIKLNV